MWWFTPAIPELGKLRQEVQEFKASLGYKTNLFLKGTNKIENLKVTDRH